MKILILIPSTLKVANVAPFFNSNVSGPHEMVVKAYKTNSGLH